MVEARSARVACPLFVSMYFATLVSLCDAGRIHTVPVLEANAAVRDSSRGTTHATAAPWLGSYTHAGGAAPPSLAGLSAGAGAPGAAAGSLLEAARGRRASPHLAAAVSGGVALLLVVFAVLYVYIYPEPEKAGTAKTPTPGRPGAESSAAPALKSGGAPKRRGSDEVEKPAALVAAEPAKAAHDAAVPLATVATARCGAAVPDATVATPAVADGGPAARATSALEQSRASERQAPPPSLEVECLRALLQVGQDGDEGAMAASAHVTSSHRRSLRAVPPSPRRIEPGSVSNPQLAEILDKRKKASEGGQKK